MATAKREVKAEGATTDELVVRSSGNVFADLGFGNPEEEIAKAKLVSAISQAVSVKKLTQTKVSELVGVDQPTLSKLLRGRTTGFSIDRLFDILTLLGQDVEIRIKPGRKNSEGRVTVAY